MTVIRVQEEHRFGVSVAEGFAYITDPASYRLVVEYEPRGGLRGLYDRVLVRRGIERALKQTIRNLEGVLESR